VAYLPDTLPFPAPLPDSAPFWAHCRGRRLRFQACAACGLPRHPPGPRCPDCQSDATAWREAPQRGRIFSYTVAHHPADASVRGRGPYNVVLVEFPELPGVRLVSNLVDAEPAVGMAVTLVWEDGPQGQPLPRFRRA
jgi:uncharacterized protein